jgi:N-acetylmuramoyl-L-alanine amidase CwlA
MMIMKCVFKTERKLLSINRYSRPGRLLKGMRGIVVHWVANPGSTPAGNRNYFENRKSGDEGFGSAHEIIGIAGERLVCIPEKELAYHVGSKKYTKKALAKLSSYPNNYTYGIEMCHRGWTGEFSEATLDSAAHRCAELCLKRDLDPLQDIWTNQQVVGWKDCPRWFVKNPKEFEKFKEKVEEIMMGKKLEKWQIELGQKAVKELAGRNVLNNPEQWLKEEKLAEPAPTWLMLVVLARYAKEDDKNENKN